MKYLFLVFMLAATMVTAQKKFKGSPAEFEGYKVGDVATDFSLKNVDGNMVSLKDYPDAKGFVLVFTCNHCPYSVLYEDRLLELDKKFKPMGYQMIAINPNDPEIYEGDSYELMQKRAEEKGFTFPYVFDEGQKIFPQYGATKTPHVYFVDSDRVVQYIGAIDDNANEPSEVKETFLENAVKMHSEGKAVEPSVTKAIGCSIRVLDK